MQAEYEIILENMDPALQRCMFSIHFEFLKDSDDRKSILAFLCDVKDADNIGLEIKKNLFFQLKGNINDENLKSQFIRCN